MDPRIINPGKNCWKAVPASRVAFLVDSASYYRAFYRAVQRARKTVYIVGWDIDRRVQLLRGEEGDGTPVRLGKFLNRAARKLKLDIYILVWDPALIYRFEREAFPWLSLGWKSPRRVRFHLDSSHPLGSSLHQKIVVIDDEVAFSGGIDLGARRWDTSEHRSGDNRRRDPGGKKFPPFHDLQMAVSGEAAARLGELARRRWERATGEKLEPPSAGGDPWPENLCPDLEDIPVAIARTYPPYRGLPAIREVEALYLDAVAAARRFIYIENQYFTSRRIGEALARRLEERDGPEVVLVLPRHCQGWLEESTMGVLRERRLGALRSADRYGRLGVYYPVTENATPVMVHSQAMIVDDLLLRIGSANLSNRSLGTDVECDLALERRDDESAGAISGFRDRLLAEHLGRERGEISRELARSGSLLETIGKFQGGGRDLRQLETEKLSPIDFHLDPQPMADPEQPISSEEYLEKFLSPPAGNGKKKGWISLGILGLLVISAALFWSMSGAEEWLHLENFQKLIPALRENFWGPLLVIAVFVIGGLLMTPVTWMIVGTSLVFGPVWGFVYSLVGSLLSAAAAYLAGRLFWEKTVHHLAGSRLSRLRKWLAPKSVPAIAIIRNIPVAPYTLVNLLAGSMRIGFWGFILGTAIGMLPGMIALVFFSARILKLVRDPSAANILIAAGALVLVVILAALLQRLLNRNGVSGRNSGGEDE
ncbi:MAG: VTT domain-containing protein [Candidatus Erginobacter occultus]|nr:VTT domain-containing protein [Candidatus Erginobacter occultus]